MHLSRRSGSAMHAIPSRRTLFALVSPSRPCGRLQLVRESLRKEGLSTSLPFISSGMVPGSNMASSGLACAAVEVLTETCKDAVMKRSSSTAVMKRLLNTPLQCMPKAILGDGSLILHTDKNGTIMICSAATVGADSTEDRKTGRAD